MVITPFFQQLGQSINDVRREGRERLPKSRSMQGSLCEFGTDKGQGVVDPKYNSDEETQACLGKIVEQASAS